MKRVLVTDIEGTTSSIAFVRDVLFPYAHRELPAFVRDRGGEPEVRRWLDEVALEIGGDPEDDLLVETLRQWIDEDRKHSALKALQGMIWKRGYAQGDFHAHVYADVPPALRAWKHAGHPLAVYSSGSVAAQRLFFAHTPAGDLSGLFTAHFDTSVGHKGEVGSYHAIADALQRPPGEICFLSDVIGELDAAREAGLSTVLVDRREDYPVPRDGAAAGGHRRIERFDELDPRS